MRGYRALALLAVLVFAVYPVVINATALAGPNPAQQCRTRDSGAEPILSTVEPEIRRFLGRHPKSTTPGVSVAIVYPSPDNPAAPKTVIINCGVTTLDGIDPTTSRTVYELGSETKVFTATALAQLSLRGVAGLDTTLQSLLPQPYVAPESTCESSNKATITLRQLATHNSGLERNPKNAKWDTKNPEGHENYTRTDLYESFAAGWPRPCAALASTPGTSYLYSNWAFALLGTLLADRYAPDPSNVPNFTKLIEDLVTGPLGMHNTRLDPIPPTPEMAQPNCDSSVAIPCYWNNVNAYAGGGGLVSTIADMATFVAANLGFNQAPNIWPALQLTHQGQGIGPDCATCSGLGWMITAPHAPDSVSEFTMLSKDGATWGMQSHTYLFPDACWGITFLSNSDQSFPLSTKAGFAGPIISTLGPKRQCAHG